MKRISGFTLIEILIAITIIAIMATLVSINLAGRTDQAKVTAAKAQIQKFEQAVTLFHSDNGYYPSTEQGLKALVEKPVTGRIPEKYPKGGYLKGTVIPKDPWGKDYIYISPGVKNEGFVDIESYGADGEEGGEEFNADIQNWNLQK